MSGRTLSAAATASIAAEETDEVWLTFVTIDYQAGQPPIRVVNNIEEVISLGNAYIGLPFELDLPDEGERLGEARLRVDNVDRQIVEAIRSIQSPPQVSIHIALANQADVIEYQLDNLTLRDVTYDAASVQGYLRYEDISIEPVSDAVTPSRFPGLF